MSGKSVRHGKGGGKGEWLLCAGRGVCAKISGFTLFGEYTRGRAHVCAGGRAQLGNKNKSALLLRGWD